MRKGMLCLLALPVLLVCGVAGTGLAGDEKDNAKDEAALLKNATAFVGAFNKGDAAKLAAFWTADGDYVDRTGRHLKGRVAIEKAFKRFFTENKGAKLRIDS